MFTASEFTDADWMGHLDSIDVPDLNDWMRGQAARGLDYYKRRLQRLRLRGRRVLDAGCGVGNWTLALANSFDDVIAIDNDPVRLSVLEGMAPKFGGRILTRLATIEQLPLDSASLDAVFCNGVIFLADFNKALSEFARVLKPGAQLYVTYNGKGWWRHLIRDRGVAEPQCIIYGANGLISRFFMLIDALAPERTIGDDVREALKKDLLKYFPPRRLFWGKGFEQSFAQYLECEDERSARVSDAAISLWRADTIRSVSSVPAARGAIEALRCVDDLCADGIPGSYKARIARDLASRIVMSKSNYAHEIHTYAHEPEEMTAELVQHGFHSIESAHEGCLCLDSESPPTAPIYPISLDVFESLARR